MKAYSIPALIIATICLTIALSDILAWFKRSRKNSDIAFILICLGGAFFCICCAGEYSVDTPIQSIFWLKGEVIASAFSGFALLWYVSEITGLVRRPYLYFTLVWSIISILTQIPDLGNLTWVASQPLILHVDLPFGLDFLYQEVARGEILIGIATIGFALQVYLFVVVIRYRKSGNRRQTLILFFALSFVIFAQLVDFCVGIGLFTSIFLLEYAWLATILVVGLNRSNDFFEAAIARKALERTDLELQISQATLSTVIDSTDDLIWSVEIEGWCLLTFNRAFRDHFSGCVGQTVSAGIGFCELLPSEGERQRWVEIYRHGLNNLDYSIEYQEPDSDTVLLISINHLRRDGSIFGLSVFARDITERKSTEQRMNQALIEKEVLLREIHHRTKNNMNVIISMLRLQSNQLGDDALKRAFAVSIDRIITMSLVHSRLYGSGNLARINLKDYLEELTQRLLVNRAMPEKQPILALQLENLFVTIDMAMNCGMIVNELVTNALKYAFPTEKAGEIRIKAKQYPLGEIVLTVSDNGIGLPTGFDPKSNGKLGFKLIHTLSRDSLGGHLSYMNEAGFSCSVRFRMAELGKSLDFTEDQSNIVGLSPK